MLRKLAGGLPTGEYSRRYLGPNSGEWIVHAATSTRSSGRCVDRLSRNLSRSAAHTSWHETVRTVRIRGPVELHLARKHRISATTA